MVKDSLTALGLKNGAAHTEPSPSYLVSEVWDLMGSKLMLLVLGFQSLLSVPALLGRATGNLGVSSSSLAGSLFQSFAGWALTRLRI